MVVRSFLKPPPFYTISVVFFLSPHCFSGAFYFHGVTSTIPARFVPKYRIWRAPGRAQSPVLVRCISKNFNWSWAAFGVFLVLQESYSTGYPRMTSYPFYIFRSFHNSY